MIDMKAYSEIQRQLGVIEGAASGIVDSSIRAMIFDACETLSELIDAQKEAK